MSADFYITQPDCPTCGCSRRGWNARNMTYNVQPMFMAATGKVFSELDGMSATQACLVVDDAISLMQRFPEAFKSMDAPNGWGTYEQFLPWLVSFREDLLKAEPDATVTVRG